MAGLMSEILNLRTLCRCCHRDGSFKSLQVYYVIEKEVEVYSTMLRGTFDISMTIPPVDGSNSICDVCIQRLRDAAKFKQQVLLCEKKFHEYCKNEQSLFVKQEITYDYDCDEDQKCHLEIKVEDYTKQTIPIEYNPEETTVEESTNKKTMRVKDYNDDDRNRDFDDNSGLDDPNDDKFKRDETKLEKKVDPESESLITTEKGTFYKCNLCDNMYSAVSSLRKHLKRRHDITYKCSACDEVFSDRSKYSAHKKTHSKQTKLWSCQFCPKTFKTAGNRNQHERIHTKKVQFQCDLCKKFFPYKLTLTRHILGHYGRNKNFVCDVCGLTFYDKTNMRKHVLIVHHKIRPFKCTVCPKTFTLKKYLTVHFRDHTGERPFSCEVCLLSFNSTRNLERHMQFRHSGNSSDPKKCVCKICSEEFDTRGKLQSHMRNHNGQKEFKCHICVKDFCSSSSLKRHIDEHSGIKQYLCEICNIRFTQKTPLMRHNSRFHDPNKIVREKVKCDLCNVYYKDLEKHMNAHNKRPFACEWCSKRYPQKNTLNRHIKHVHIGIKEHACTMCDKKYFKNADLKIHMRKKHK